MEPSEISALWQSYGEKLDRSLQLNRHHAEEITKIKVRSFLLSMTPVKLFAVVCGLLWTGFVGITVAKTVEETGPFFQVSAAIQALLTATAVTVYLYQLFLIYRADINSPVRAMQEQLARLEVSTLWVTRILFLQLPVWTTFYITPDVLRNGPWYLLVLQASVTLAAVGASVWLFVNIRSRNRSKKWFRVLFAGKEWTPIHRAAKLLEQWQGVPA